MTHDPRSRTRASTLALAIALASGSAFGAPIAWKNPDAPSIIGQRVGIANPTVLVRQSAQRPDGAHIIVALGSSPDAQTRADLAARGLELLSPVGSGAYFAHVKPGADAAALGGAIVGAEPITRAHKLHPSVASDQIPSWAVLGVSHGLRSKRRLLARVEVPAARFIGLREPCSSLEGHGWEWAAAEPSRERLWPQARSTPRRACGCSCRSSTTRCSVTRPPATQATKGS